MALTRTRNLTYRILTVTITAAWGAQFSVAELDGADELRRLDLEATPEECASLLATVPDAGQTLQQAMGSMAYALVGRILEQM